MGCLYVVLLISFGACLAESEFKDNAGNSTDKFNPENNPSELLKNVTAIFERSCPKGSIKLEELIALAPQCYDNINLDNETMCSSAERLLDECVRPTTTFFETCLKGESKTLPKFLLNVMHSLIEHVCDIKTKYLLELLNPCYRETSSFDATMYSKFISKLHKYIEMDKLPSKNDLCNELLDFKVSVVSHFEATCFNKVTREALTGFVEAILRPCSNAKEVA